MVAFNVNAYPSPPFSFSLSLSAQPSRLIGLQTRAAHLPATLACDCRRTWKRVGNMQACRPIQALTDQSRKTHREGGRWKRRNPQEETASTNNGVIIRESHSNARAPTDNPAAVSDQSVLRRNCPYNSPSTRGSSCISIHPSQSDSCFSGYILLNPATVHM